MCSKVFVPSPVFSYFSFFNMFLFYFYFRVMRGVHHLARQLLCLEELGADPDASRKGVQKHATRGTDSSGAHQGTLYNIPLKGIGVRGYIGNYINILRKMVAQFFCSIWPQIRKLVHGKIGVELSKISRGRQGHSEFCFSKIKHVNMFKAFFFVFVEMYISINTKF